MWTNVQSQSRKAQSAQEGTVVPATRADAPVHGMNPCLHTVPIQSLFVPTLQDIVKSYINVMNNVVEMISIIHPIYLNLHPGTTITTTNLQLPTSRSIMTTPPILIKVPEKRGSPGSLGKTSPSLNITRIPPDGSTTQSPTTNISLMKNRRPSILQSP